MLRLHRAHTIKREVAEELPWFNSGMLKPKMVSQHPPSTSIERFQALIHNTRYDQYIPGCGMNPEELSTVCCKRWITCDQVVWLVNKLNSMQSSILCIYLNYTRNIQRFVLQRVPPGKAKPSGLLFILNVGRAPDGSTFIGNEAQQGSHWSICYLDKAAKTVTYADSLAYKSLST